MKINKWKMAFYGLLMLGFIILYVYFNKLALLALAPIGFIIYLVESFKGLKQFGRWKELTRRERFDAILSLLILVVIAVIIGLIIWAFLSTRR